MIWASWGSASAFSFPSFAHSSKNLVEGLVRKAFSLNSFIMAKKKISILNVHDLLSAVMDAWNAHLGAEEMDPTSGGKWIKNGPNNNGGLLGLMEDKLATSLEFDSSQVQPRVNHIKEVAVNGTCVNNVDNEVKQTATIDRTYTNTAMTSTTETSTLTTGISVAIKGGVDFMAKGEVTTTVSVSYAHSWSKTESEMETKATKAATSVLMTVPPGEVYQTVLTYDELEFEAPYKAYVYLEGKSVANYAASIKGSPMHEATAGDICEWINKYKTAGENSKFFEKDPQNPERGRIYTEGKLKAKQYSNFMSIVNKVTKNYREGLDGQVLPGEPLKRETVPVVEGAE